MEQNENLKSPDQTKTVNSQPFGIRPAVETDVAFIFNSWLKSYRNTEGSVSNAVYFQFHHKLIETLLERSDVKVMHQIDDPNEIIGYLCYELVENIPVIHYVYIKNSFRKLNLLEKLLTSGNITKQTSGFYTHITPIVKKLVNNNYKQFVFNPYLAK
jgi:hypothetical protein